MVNKRDPDTNSGADDAPELPPRVAVEDLHVPPELDLSKFDPVATGGRFFWEDYEAGERVLHPQGITIEDAEHQLATRLYQNNARVPFNDYMQRKSQLGGRALGALRRRRGGVKNLAPSQEPVELKVKDPESGRETHHPNVVLELDY